MGPGDVLGAYRVVEQIAAGGMGTVWVAEHTILGRRAALKVLHPEMCARVDIVRRFFNEARAATTIPDPGIVQIFDFGYHDDGSAYIVMELLIGEVLSQRIARARLDLVQALRISRQVASTLAAAHARGIIHRDLKPDNIFMAKDPEVAGGERAKILDFGIAKLSDERRTGVFDLNAPRASSGVMGTPLYMSPEQCQALNVDARSDVYALGCVMFQMLTGAPPFDANDMAALVAQHLSAPAPAPSSIVPTVPASIDKIVACCLAKDPAERYASAAELALAIAAASASSTDSVPELLRHVSRGELDNFGDAADEPTNMQTVSSERRRAGTAAIAEPVVPAVPVVPLATQATTLSHATGAGLSVPQPRSRWRFLAIVGLSVTAAVGLGAWRLTRHPAPAENQPETTAETGAATVLAVVAPDPNAVLTERMTAVVTQFAGWARDHEGAPCPQLADLGEPTTDPWGHPLAITCLDQPQNQMVGVISAGPDGVTGTTDDVGSWQLGRAVTEIVHGPRWIAAPSASLAAKDSPDERVIAPTQPAPPKVSSQHPKPVHKVVRKLPASPLPPGIALDANGVPVHR